MYPIDCKSWAKWTLCQTGGTLPGPLCSQWFTINLGPYHTLLPTVSNGLPSTWSHTTPWSSRFPMTYHQPGPYHTLVLTVSNRLPSTWSHSTSWPSLFPMAYHQLGAIALPGLHCFQWLTINLEPYHTLVLTVPNGLPSTWGHTTPWSSRFPMTYHQLGAIPHPGPHCFQWLTINLEP